MVSNATFNNISVILRQSVLLVEEYRENHRAATSHWQTLSHYVVLSTPRLREIQSHTFTFVVIGTDCTSIYKSNYYTITTMTALVIKINLPLRFHFPVQVGQLCHCTDWLSLLLEPFYPGRSVVVYAAPSLITGLLNPLSALEVQKPGIKSQIFLQWYVMATDYWQYLQLKWHY